ncbi:hypothetical protein BDW22DRAFT_1334867 [Trametopsis cervina]|nr:hypothetical protein BDW22DRAFT_1334867 [Trametopsis cervina]
MTSQDLINLVRAEVQSRATVSGTLRSKKEESANSAAPSRGKGRGQGRKPKGRGQDKGKAAASTADSADITCYRCGGKGHKSNTCSTPAPKKKKRANAAVEKAKSTAGESAAGTQVVDTPNTDVPTSPREVDLCGLVECSEYASAGITEPHHDLSLIVDIYDFGATSHMTPYRHLLEHYRPLESYNIRAANSQLFKVAGKGDMYITMPNGESGSRYLLRGVL